MLLLSILGTNALLGVCAHNQNLITAVLTLPPPPPPPPHIVYKFCPFCQYMYRKHMGQGPKTPSSKVVNRLLLMELHRQSRDLVNLGGGGGSTCEFE